MRRLRFAFPLALATLIGVAAPAPVRADDARDPVTGDPERFADFSSRSIALADAALPPGWSLLDATTEGADAVALEAAVRTIATDIGVAAPGAFHLERRSIASPEGTKAHLVLYDLERPAPDFVDAVRVGAAKHGWLFREMGTPRHGLLVAAPEALREKVVEIQRAFAVHLLSVAITSALNRGQGLAAVGYARIALAFDPKLAHPRFVVGITAKQIALLKKPMGDLAPAIEHLQAALSKDASPPLGARDRVSATGNLGQTLLNKGGADAAARDLLKEAVAGAAEIDRTWGIAFRYDLACAHGRLKETDEAFALLGGVLSDLVKAPVEGIDEIWRKDPDFENIREDARWKALLATYGATAPPK